LIRIDPAAYAGNIARERIELNSDNSWLTSTTYAPGYNKLSFDDSEWLPADILMSTYNQFVALGQDPQNMWLGKKIVIPDTSMADSMQFGFADTATVDSGTAFADSMMAVEDSVGTDSGFTATTEAVTESAISDSSFVMGGDTVSVYFRKIINIPGTPVDANIYITADNDYRFFLNEEYIIDDVDDSFAVIDTIDFGYLSYYMNSGDNILAVHAIDTDKSGGGVKLHGYFEVLPIDLESAMNAITDVKKLDVDPILLKKINTLNKNRITIEVKKDDPNG